MEAVLTAPNVCTVHSVLLFLAMLVVAPAELNVDIGSSSPGSDILCEQCIRVDKGKG